MIFIILLSLVNLTSAEDNFYDCKIDNNCTLSLGNCGELISINKDFKNRSIKFFKKNKDLISCNSLVSPKISDFNSPVCLKGSCVIRKTINSKEIILKENKSNLDQLEKEIAVINKLREERKYDDCLMKVNNLRNQYLNNKLIEPLFFNCLHEI